MYILNSFWETVLKFSLVIFWYYARLPSVVSVGPSLFHMWWFPLFPVCEQSVYFGGVFPYFRSSAAQCSSPYFPSCPGFWLSFSPCTFRVNCSHLWLMLSAHKLLGSPPSNLVSLPWAFFPLGFKLVSNYPISLVLVYFQLGWQSLHLIG